MTPAVFVSRWFPRASGMPNPSSLPLATYPLSLSIPPSRSLSYKVLNAAQTAAVQKSSADPLLKNKIYWLMHNKPVLPTNEAGFDNRVVSSFFA